MAGVTPQSACLVCKRIGSGFLGRFTDVVGFLAVLPVASATATDL